MSSMAFVIKGEFSMITPLMRGCASMIRNISNIKLDLGPVIPTRLRFMMDTSTHGEPSESTVGDVKLIYLPMCKVRMSG